MECFIVDVLYVDYFRKGWLCILLCCIVDIIVEYCVNGDCFIRFTGKDYIIVCGCEIFL